jgi:3-oxoadipate CoA-transferase alpha subunit
VITSFGVANAIAVPLTGWLTQRFGAVRLWTTSVLLFVLASMLCGLATSLEMLVAARVVQGLGSGAVFALAQAAVADFVAGPQRGRFQAYFSGVFATSALVAPLAGGLLTQYFSWRAIFWANLPIAVFSLWMMRRVLPVAPPREQTESGIDWLGAALLAAGRVRKLICSFPRSADSQIFDGLYRAGRIELELVPQGNLAERMRAAGAGVGAFYTPTGFGTDLAAGKETRRIDGRDYVLEFPIRGDLALIKARQGDRWGNLVYRKAARNFNPIMAMASSCTVAQVEEIVPLGALDPEVIVTPGIFVTRVIQLQSPAEAAA